jgi:cystathionine beta-lyase/cystathionine gamma-synthase
MRFATRAIHDFQEPEAGTGAVTVPVYLTSTFKQDGVGNLRGGYEYARSGNPSRASLEGSLAGLENARFGLCFSSGSAATTAVLDLLSPGDELLTTLDVYGGTYRLFKKVYAKYGIQFRFLETCVAEEIAGEITDRTRLIWIESPTNPLLNIIDIEKLSAARPHAVLLCVDNTFATPCFQNPLDLGADLVVHSTTKYLGGHSDVIGGALATNTEKIYRACRFYQNAAGAVPSPFDCFLIQRGIKTLEIRMERHQSNAFEAARFLSAHPRVRRVFFPGLPGHRGFETARRQMRGQSGMVSFQIDGDRSAAERFLSRLRVFTLAESLGGVESLACYPHSMTHGAVPEAEKERIGVTRDLVRLSVGIESVEDLIEDLEQALSS